MNWRDLPPLSSLRAFAVLAEAGSFSKAGVALNVSHAAISQQVRALEARLGASLLRREGRSVALTPEGARLASALETGFGAIARAVDELTGADATRPLQITTTPAFAASWLMPRLSDFRRLHPAIELMLNPTGALVELTPGGTDLAIRFGEGRWPGLAAQLLLETSFVVVAAPSLIGTRRIAGPGDLLDLPWLQEYGTDEIAIWLRRHGVIEAKARTVTHLPGHLMLEGLRRGDGVGAAARAFIEPDIAEGRLAVLFEEARLGSGYYIVTRPGPMRPPVKAFASWLRQSASAVR